MRRELAEITCCPVHKSRLELRVEEEDDHGDIVAGGLVCSACDFEFPIENGIPNLLPPDYHVSEEGAIG